MKKLNENWITQEPLDFEYNQYTLLAYLSEVNKAFGKVKIYPLLDDLQYQADQLTRLRSDANKLKASFPKRINSIDFQKRNIVYEEVVEVDKYVEHVEKTVDYALPRIEEVYADGQGIYTFVKEHCVLEPIGMLPLHVKEGYLFINLDSTTETNVYGYSLGLFKPDESKTPSIRVRFIEKIRKARTETYEFLKRRLIRKFKAMPNPATYLFQVQMKLPFEETVLPMAREFLVSYITRPYV